MNRNKPIIPATPGAGMKKRKDPPAPGNNSSRDAGTNNGRSGPRNAKRVRRFEAWAIQSQPPDAALKDGELDTQAFLNAREFEIRALETSMRKSKATNASRAFQMVPRSMRRRTASHNVKRVPKRLRARAKREMQEDNTPTVEARRRRPRSSKARLRAETAKRLGILAKKKEARRLRKAEEKDGSASGGPSGLVQRSILSRPPRPKIRRNELNEPPKPKAKFRKRQIDKTWLPTHLWLAKRARMTEPKNPLWRFAIPLTPSEKCYRPTHRASGEKGAVAWDMSYVSTIGLYGSAEGIERVLKALGVVQANVWDDRGRKWRSGSRSWSGSLNKERKDGRRDIGPATIVWNPETSPDNAAADVETTNTRNSKREVFIRIHPCIFLEVFNELLKLIKMQTPQLYVEDLRFEIGSIDIQGPGSTETLLGILRPYATKKSDEEQHAALFKTLVGVSNPSSLPADAVLAFSARDPRLHYPPKRVAGPNSPDGSSLTDLLDTLTKWPAEDGLKPAALFDRDARFAASRLPSQKSLNRRRSSTAPGKELGITAADPPIPVILLASRSRLSQTQGTWTILAPWKCILPIWYSLVHYPISSGGNPRFGGLNETRQVAFEQGVPWFPGDFPGTDAGAAWELDQRLRRRQEWERRPKGKRPEWKSLELGAGRKGEVGDPFACDFEHLVGGGQHLPAPAENGIVPGTQMDVDGADESAKAEPVPTPPAESMRKLHRMPKPAFSSLLRPSSLEQPGRGDIVTVYLTLVGRGVATPCARIYRLPFPGDDIVALPSTQAEVPATQPQGLRDNAHQLPGDLREQWLAKLPVKKTGSGPKKGQNQLRRMPAGATLETRKRLLAESLLGPGLPYSTAAPNLIDIDGHPLCPDEQDLIGFVTTGSFSLSEGKGTAMGSLSATKALEAVRMSGGEREGRLCVVRNVGESVGWLARWELV